MKRREYKIKFENGELIPQEFIDIKGIQEGVVIFSDLEPAKTPKDINSTINTASIVSKPQEKELSKDLNQLMNIVGIASREPDYEDLAEEIDKIVYDEQ